MTVDAKAKTFSAYMGDVAKLLCTNRRGVSAIGRPRMLSVAHASLLRKRRIVGIAFGPTAIIRGSIVGIRARGHTQPVRQIWVGQKLAAKGDQIRLALLKAIPPRCLDQSRRLRSTFRDIFAE